MPFGGDTYDRGRDRDRLKIQLAAVLNVVQDGRWHTLGELSGVTGAPEASVSARLRDLRKEKFGGRVVERQFVSKGLWQYRLQPDPWE